MLPNQPRSFIWRENVIWSDPTQPLELFIPWQMYYRFQNTLIDRINLGDFADRWRLLIFLLFFNLFLCLGKKRDRREALDKFCQEIQEVWLGADAAVMRQSHVWKERLWGSWQSSMLVGGPVGKGQNLSKRAFRIIEWERKSLSRGEEERRWEREWGWERGSRNEKMIQTANKLPNAHAANKESKSNFYTGKITINFYHS